MIRLLLAAFVALWAGAAEAQFVVAPATATSGNCLKFTDRFHPVQAAGPCVTAPASATDNAFPRFNGTNGQVLQDSKNYATDTGSAYNCPVIPNDGLNDSATIQTCVDTYPGQKIIVPDGDITIGAQIVVNDGETCISGNGQNSTYLTVTYAGTAGEGAIKFTPTDPTNGSRVQNGCITDLTIRRTASSVAGSAIELVQATNFTIRGVSIPNFYVGFDFLGVSNVFMSNMNVFSGGYYAGVLQTGSRLGIIRSGYATNGDRIPSYGVHITNSSFNTTSGATAIIEHCIDILSADGVYISGSVYVGECKYGIYVTAESSATGNNLANISVADTFFDGNLSQMQHGFYVAYNAAAPASSVSAVTIVSSHFETLLTDGIYLGHGGISKVVITGNGFGSIGGWGVNAVGVQGVTITGNVFSSMGSTATATTGSVYLQASVINTATVTGNVFDYAKAGTSQVRIDANSTGAITVVGNSFDSNNFAFTEVVLTGAVSNITVDDNTTTQATPVKIIKSSGPVIKATAAGSGVAPGAGFARMEVVCGTTNDKLKLIIYGGTSTTPSTIIDDFGTDATTC